MRTSTRTGVRSTTHSGAARRGWPIWAALIALGLGIVVPVIVFCGFLISSFGRSEHARYETRVAAYAEEAAASVDRELKDRMSILRALANSPLLDRAHLREFYREAKGLAGYVGSDIVLFDPVSRDLLLDTRVPYGTRLTGKMPERAAEVLHGSEALIQDGRTDEFADDHSVIIYLPAERESTVTAVVAMLFERHRLSEVLKQDVSPPDWTSAIVDRDGVILARSKDAERFVTTPAPPDMRILPPRGEVKIARIQNLDGKPALAGFAQSRLARWVVVVSIPSDVIEAPLTRSWMLFGVAGGAFLALSVAFALAMGGYVTRPVLGLARAAADVGRGETVQPVVSGLREIDLVSAALSRASEDRRRSEEQVRLLMRELAHRNKNVLTLVQAIAHQTARHAKGLRDFEQEFTPRLAALAGSSDRLLSRNWTVMDLGKLIQTQLSPFPQLDSGQIRISGPRLLLKPKTAEGLGLALHELATNALKHGALSVSQGFVTIEWDVSETAFSLIWTEHHGPAVSQPSTSGFGRVVIEKMIAQLLAAHASLDFRPDGVRWSLEMPLDVLEARSPEMSSERAEAEVQS